MQGRITSPFVLRPEQAKLVESVMQASGWRRGWRRGHTDLDQ